MGGRVELVHGLVQRRDFTPVEIDRLVLVQAHFAEMAADDFRVKFHFFERRVQGGRVGDEILAAIIAEFFRAAVFAAPQGGCLLDAAVNAEFLFGSVFLQQFGLDFLPGGAVHGRDRFLAGERQPCQHEQGYDQQQVFFHECISLF